MLFRLLVTVPVGKGVELDYGLTKAPSFSIDFMESFHKVCVMYLLHYLLHLTYFTVFTLNMF